MASLNQVQCSLNPLVTNNGNLFDAAASAPFFSSINATLDGWNLSPAIPPVLRNSFNALSLTVEDKEDNIKALTTFSSSPTTAAPLHVSIIPQDNKNKYQKCKAFHSKPKTYTALTKKPSPNAGIRSNCPSMEKQPSPMANANGTVFNSYLKKNYGRNRQSSTVSYNLAISCSFGKLPGCTTLMPHTFFHIHLHTTPHIVGQNPQDTTPPMLTCAKKGNNPK